MKICLRTSFRMLDTHYAEEDRQPFQGAMQDNRVALLLWLIITIFLIQYLHSKGVVTHLVMLISNLIVLLAVLLCTDDADLHVFNSGCNSIKEIAHEA